MASASRGGILSVVYIFYLRLLGNKICVSKVALKDLVGSRRSRLEWSLAFLYARPKLLGNFFVSWVLRLGASRRSVERRRSSAIQVSGISRCNRLLVSVGLTISRLIVVWGGRLFFVWEKGLAYQFEGHETYIFAFKLFSRQQLFVNGGWYL